MLPAAAGTIYRPDVSNIDAAVYDKRLLSIVRHGPSLSGMCGAVLLVAVKRVNTLELVTYARHGL